MVHPHKLTWHMSYPQAAIGAQQCSTTGTQMLFTDKAKAGQHQGVHAAPGICACWSIGIHACNPESSSPACLIAQAHAAGVTPAAVVAADAGAWVADGSSPPADALLERFLAQGGASISAAGADGSAGSPAGLAVAAADAGLAAVARAIMVCVLDVQHCLVSSMYGFHSAAGNCFSILCVMHACQHATHVGATRLTIQTVPLAPADLKTLHMPTCSQDDVASCSHAITDQVQVLAGHLRALQAPGMVQQLEGTTLASILRSAAEQCPDFEDQVG